MRTYLKTLLRCGLLLCAFVCANAWSAEDPTAAAKSIRSKAFKFLQRNQNLDGSYGSARQPERRAAATALVIYVLASGERAYREHDGPFMSRAVDYLLKQQNRNGSFGDKKLRRLTTALAAQALRTVHPTRHKKTIKRAAAFLKTPLPKTTKVAYSFDRIAHHFATAVSTSPAPAKPLTPNADLTILKAIAMFNRQQQREDDTSQYPPIFFLTLRTVLGVLHRVPSSNALPGGSREWMSVHTKTLRATQIADDDHARVYGGFQSAGTGKAARFFATDPIVATALAGHAADLIKMNFKKIAATSKQMKPKTKVK